MNSNEHGALLIVAHGSTVNPDSSAPTLAHAAEIRRRKIFAGKTLNKTARGRPTPNLKKAQIPSSI